MSAPENLPPASFDLLVQTLASQAMVALGVIKNPMTDKIDLQPKMAKHFIDTLEILQQKTKGNLTTEEEKLLEMATHQLRMAYVALPNK